MTDDYYSTQWYRVANLKPKILSHVEIRRHEYRGLIWYFLEDAASGRGHRFNSNTYQIIGLMDGHITVQEMFDTVSKKLGEFAPSQPEVVQLLGNLNSAGLMRTDAMIDADEMIARRNRNSRIKLQKRFSNPLSIKIPIWDPNSFLDRHISRVGWLFNRWVGCLWLLLIAYSIMQAGMKWPQISQHFAVNVLQPYNLLLLFLLYPAIKLLHELGHAFAAKFGGSEVHEMGINILMFFPVPYVNVSKTRHLRERRLRLLVSAAGILVELFIAAAGLLLYLNTQAGLLQDIGFNLMLIGGISSLLFNGNPLLKFDGYYMLSDALGIPNLYQRSYQYWLYLFQFYALGQKQVRSPASAQGEAFWFVVFSISSLVYRLSILWFICVYITDKFFMLGVVLALLVVVTQIVNPFYKALRFLLFHPSLSARRGRILLGGGGLISAVTMLLFFLPVHAYTVAEGIIWVADEAQVKAGADGFVEAIHVHNDEELQSGTEILRLSDDFLQSRKKIARAKLKEVSSQLRANRDSDLVQVERLKEELRIAEFEFEHYRQKLRSMEVQANQSGRVLLPGISDMPGRYVHKGELLGYVLKGSPSRIKVVVGQDNIGRLQENVHAVNVRFAHAPEKIYSATLTGKAPEPVDRLPSAALATLGGGNIVVDTSSPGELKTLNKLFVVDLQFDARDTEVPLGSRAYVRFDHGKEAVAAQLYRRILQAFMREFNV